MTFSWHTAVSNSVYRDTVFSLITKSEGFESGIYYDSALPHHPTIGFGYNLDVNDLLEATIIQMFYPEGTSSTLLGNDVNFADDISDIINDGYVTYPTKELLQAALDNVMEDRADYWENAILINPSIPHPTTLRENFTFESEDETLNIFNVRIEQDEDAVDTWLASIPDSNERAVLVSLSYAGILTESSSLKAAIQADDRAEAWVQIRYLSNAGSLADMTPAERASGGFNGQAARRYAESDLFGLYSPNTLDEAESRQIFQAVNRHEPHIAKYDSIYEHLVGDASTKYGYTIEPLEVITQDAKDFLVAEYVTPVSTEIDITHVYVDHIAVGQTLEKNKFMGDFKNSLVLGGDGNDILDGGAGLDVIYGEADDDTLVFKQYEVSSYDTIKEYYNGGETGTDHDTLRLEFRGSELDSNIALRQEIASLYGDMVLDAPIGNFTYTFENLNLQIEGFENLEVWVDGKQVSLDLEAVDNYYIDNDLTEASGYLFDPNFYYYDYFENSYSFANWYEDVTTTAGTYTTSAGGTIIVTSEGYFTYTAASMSVVQDSFTYTVTDSTGAISTATNYFVNQIEINSLTNSYSATVAVDYNSVFYTNYSTRGPNENTDYLYDGNGKYYWVFDPDDTITGSSYSDVINSNTGNDTVYGGSGNDVISGGGSYQFGSNCIISPVFGSVSLYGQDGNDTITSGNSGNGVSSIHGTNSGDFYLSGGNGDDTIYLMEYAPIMYMEDYWSVSYTAPEKTSEVYGDAGNDYIYIANVGSDSVYGGTGNDKVVIELHSLDYAEIYSNLIGITQGLDVYDGGDDIDTIQFDYAYEDSYVGIDVDIENEIVSYNGTDHDLINFENIIGTVLDDTITGSTESNILVGSEGNDLLDGGDGNDTLIGDGTQEYSQRNDDTFIIRLNEGVDFIQDVRGSDSIQFGAGIVLSALSFHRQGYDLLIQHSDVDLVILKDHFFNVDNIETLKFSDTSSILLSDALTISLFGTDNDDRINGSPGFITDVISGGAGNDTIDGGIGNDVVSGGDGDDTFIYNLSRNANSYDVIHGEKGDDTLVIQFDEYSLLYFSEDIRQEITDYHLFLDNPANIDTASNTAGDYLFTFFGLEVSGIENLRVTLFNDVEVAVVPDAANDQFEAIAGLAITGNVFANNGNGIDRSMYDLVTVVGTFTTAQGGSITFDELGNFSYTAANSFSGADTFIYTADDGHGYTDTATMSFTVQASIEGTSSTDNLNGTSGIDHIIAYAGNDLIAYSLGSDIINGGDGFDTMDYSSSSTYGISLFGYGEGYYVYKDNYSENDYLSHIEKVIGTDFNDDMSGISGFSSNFEGGDGADNLTGNNESDFLKGEDGDDTLYAYTGDDVLDGGDGLDTLIGGDGADTFVFEANSAFNDVDGVYDFDTTQSDKLDISDLLIGYTSGVSDINDFVSLSTVGSGMDLIVDRDGLGGTYSGHAVASLNYTSGLIVNDLLTNGNLIV